MSDYLIVGIDPGVSGAIATIGPDGSARAVTMPTVLKKVGKSMRRRHDLHALRAIVRNAKEVAALHDLKLRVFIERVWPRPTNGSIGSFQMGESFGMLRGILWTMAIEHRLVRPQEWQREIFGGKVEDTKAASCAAASRLFPPVSLLLTPKCTKPNDGLADALCIAEYGRRFLKIENGPAASEEDDQPARERDPQWTYVTKP